MEIVETIEKNGYKLEIFRDEDPPDPRGWYGTGTWYVPNTPRGCCQIIDDGASEEEARKAPVQVFVYFLDHSAVHISTQPFGDSWDSWRAGVVYVTEDAIRKTYGDIREASIENARMCIEHTVANYDAYINGDAYGFLVTDSEGEEVDSGWGYYGDDGYKEIVAEFDQYAEGADAEID